ncbi:MAG: glycosyltransferase [Clostridia bacterium]|nr:glycosyltransferase [Clostridia bacterium]
MKYLAFYDVNGFDDEKRNYVLAATNKIQYICECLEKNNIHCDIISSSYTYGKRNVSGRRMRLSEYITLDMPFSIGRKNKVFEIINRWQMKASIFLRLLKIKKNETLIVYHSLFYMNLVSFLKKIKKFKLVVEAEEIYGDVIGNKKVSQKEIEFFESADAYIFPTELLDEKININKKPSVIIYGTYKVEEDRKCKFDDGKTHIVYAGTFDPRKGGVQATLSAIPYLNSKYHMHIIGFGNKEDTESVKNEIERLSQIYECKVTYDGMLIGEDYIRFLQSCNIGMSTQNPEGEFNDTSFPSKILSYLANGLHVVSVRIPVVENAEIGSIIHYYNENNGKQIADAILDISMNASYNSRKIIKNLNNEFVATIKNILE